MISDRERDVFVCVSVFSRERERVCVCLGGDRE